MSRNVNGACLATVPDFRASTQFYDTCGNVTITKTQSPAVGSTVGFGSTPIQVAATDASGNVLTCSTSLVTVDSIVPVIHSCAPPVTINACNATVPNFALTTNYTDNCGILSTTQIPTPGSNSGLGSVSVTITVKDIGLSTTSCVTQFHVQDNVAPSVTCPSTLSANADTACHFTIPDYTSSIFASDNCNSDGPVSQSNTTSMVTAGTYSIAFSSADASGNVGTCVSQLTVHDITPPSITTCAPSITLPVGSSCTAIVPDFSSQVEASDSCGPVVVDQSIAFGDTRGVGTYTVTLTVTDGAGNTASCDTSLIVEDNDAPVITSCAAPTTVEGCTEPVVDFRESVSVSDNCGIGFKTQSPPATTPLSYGLNNISITIVDTSGNTATCYTEFSIQRISP